MKPPRNPHPVFAGGAVRLSALVIAFFTFFGVTAARSFAGVQTLPLPQRATNALAGREFVGHIQSLSTAGREQAILAQVLAGNVPVFMRRLCPVTITRVADGRTNALTFFAAPDYLCVGADDDYFLAPMTPGIAQRIADQLHCALPTRKMVDAIHGAADLKLAPAPVPPSPAMTTVPVFAAHNDLVRTQRLESLSAHPAGVLVAGHKKDVVISTRLAGAPDRVALYGWHRTNGTVIQPLYLGHSATWVDYSHGIRLVQQRMVVNGETTTLAQVLADPKLAGGLSDEGVIASPRYPTDVTIPLPPSQAGAMSSAPPEFKSSGHFGERIASLAFEPGTRILLNAPAAADFKPDKPVLLIFYALPNGNTIEQTLGRKIQPGDDWRFEIQHIGAQTRFLRALLTNRTVVVAYLEAASLSWPAWRKRHGDQAIPALIAGVKRHFASWPLEVVLTGHSGGGSLTLGYLNARENIPDDVVRIAFLDSNYAYDAARGHGEKLTAWLKSSDRHFLCVLAYNDAIALLDGQPFVSAAGGTWGRSHAMLRDLGAAFAFTSRTNHAGLQFHSALRGRIQFLLKKNPDRKVLHTVQVERNGFIHAMVAGTADEHKGYDYFGERAYQKWIRPE